MKIVHIDFTGTFNSDMNYQENIISRINSLDGHQVTFITSCYMWNNGEIVKTNEMDYVMADGVRLIRLSYKTIGSKFLTLKIRQVNNLYTKLKEIKPDIVMLHCVQTLAALQIIKYIKRNQNVTLYIDSHTDYNNSAKGFFSKYLLHGVFYKNIAKKLEKYVDNFWCCSYECMLFLKDRYSIKDNKLELYPLGGIIFNDNNYTQLRHKIRERYSIGNDDILVVHAGKMDLAKKTGDVVRAVARLNDKHIKLILIGTLEGNLYNDIKNIITECKQIEYVGWKNGEELLEYFCATDLYLQPGSQSASMQNAACCRCALALYPHLSHIKLLNDLAYYVSNEEEIYQLLSKLSNDRNSIDLKMEITYKFAKEKLDYNVLARKLYEKQ